MTAILMEDGKCNMVNVRDNLMTRKLMINWRFGDPVIGEHQ